MVAKNPKEFNKWNVQFRNELFISVTILILPFLIYAHLAFSENFDSIEMLFFEWKHGFKNNQLFVWNLLADLIPLCLLLLAYATIMNSFRHFITPFIILFVCFTISDLYYLDTMFFVTSFKGVFFGFFVIINLLLADKLFLNAFRNKSLAFNYKEVVRELIALNNTKIIRSVEKTARLNYEANSMQYACRLHYYSELMQKAIDNSIRSVNEGIGNKKNKTNRLIIQLILILAFLLNFAYLLLPRDIKSVEFAGIIVHDFGFGTINDLGWYLFKKISLLIVFAIWFYTSKTWWRIAILSPIIIYAYQLVEVFNDNQEIESYGNSYVFPVIVLISILILPISRIIKLRTKMLDYIDLFQSEMNKEIRRLSKSF